MSELNLAVVGAGVVGLTTAFELKKQFRNANITLLADKFNNDTTSAVAAGLFRPGTSFIGPDENITRKWINDSYYYWDDIRKTPDGAKAGVTQVSGYIFSSEHRSVVQNHYLEKLVPVYRVATKEELKLCPGSWKYGCFFTTILTQCELYLPWIYSQFLQIGGKVRQKKIDSLYEIGTDSNNYDVIVNCTGLGAKFLCNDNKLVPMRGQVLKVQAPWIKTFFYGDYDTYVIPGFNCVTLGGCRQYDSFNMQPNKYDSLDIKERCESLVPSLKSAKILSVKVGLRPHRSSVRVEKEIKQIGNRQVKIVHNYGHGGYGVTSAPGTSLYAVELVKEMLIGNNKL